MSDSAPTRSEVVVRPASEGDFDALTAVWRSAVEATHDFLSEADVDHYELRVRNEFLPAVDVHVAVDAQDRPLGFIGMAGHRVEMLFVDASARGRGVGSALLFWAAARHTALEVDVNEQNPQARGFYESQGFEAFDRSPLDADGRPFPVIHMRRPAPHRP
ncbi:acetyltransferase [Nocardiopsis sp. RSe5-2]|uniref:Acetyltransferase n=1 Tax=Nocardiopsis endophytica TaxID=3018445 RepID=A0ABT4UEA9_9ACTN|nr:acetyltransferase [Nocardiopsis endophytica]MDA2814685.1 acetyltransferase [Nocardiopsis endophytica]